MRGQGDWQERRLRPQGTRSRKWAAMLPDRYSLSQVPEQSAEAALTGHEGQPYTCPLAHTTGRHRAHSLCTAAWVSQDGCS